MSERLEYECKKAWEAKGHIVIRAAGSHGPFDLVAIRDGGRVTLSQCKLVSGAREMARLLRDFRANPPLNLSGDYHQCLEVKVVGSSRIEQCFV